MAISEPGGMQVWIYDISRDMLTRLTFEANANLDPVWTPDGKRIAFTSIKEGPLNIFSQQADGSGGLERLTTSEYTEAPSSWSPDGELLAYLEINPTTGRDIWVLLRFHDLHRVHWREEKRLCLWSLSG